ncbi:MAG: tetratricopeptide repeat protein [Colwellia polaris]|jgi:tetratricopeptide (TPR) repeat protein|uniref:tetratricopeptide repeat protein n=1 Tax=Colwellia polaris TaxID=326537 RepID=UPI000A170D45|nr:tetratricopeptide repeat protein [Colwellia polaris]|tara:strand:+ start:3178 stop:4332 length:1155 start_codon:yes stop_codon:yes gene_type:complete
MAYCRWFFIFTLILCIGCSSVKANREQQVSVSLNSALFSPNNMVISENDLYALSEQQQQLFLTFYQQKISQGYLPHEVVKLFLESSLDQFTYFGQTYTASEAMLNSSGNCMSLAILTTAFSRLVGVEIDYRKMNSLPVYEKHGNVLLSSSHVQSLLYDPSFIAEENTYYIYRPAIIIDYFPQDSNIRSKTVNPNEFLAMYYVNKAAELYIKEEFDNAFAYAKHAYHLDVNNVSSLNLLALLHKKKGDIKSAERLYLAAMASNDVNISVLDNYVTLLKQQGRFRDAKKVKSQIENIYDPNPYHWLEKAQLASYNKEYSDAERYYRKVIKLAPYVKQAYLELHEIYLVQGKVQYAISILEASLPWVHEPKQKQKYKKQLYQLSAAI